MSKGLIELAQRQLLCDNRELAALLGIPFEKLMTWQEGDKLSQKSENFLRRLLKIGDMNPYFVMQSGSVGNAQKWLNLLKKLAIIVEAENGIEGGVSSEDDPWDKEEACCPLTSGIHLLSAKTFELLTNIGVEIPRIFPEEFEVKREALSPNEFEKLVQAPLIKLFYELYRNYLGFYDTYEREIEVLLKGDSSDELVNVFENIEAHLIEVTGCLLPKEIVAGLVGKGQYSDFKEQVFKKYCHWLKIISLETGAPAEQLIKELLGEEGASFASAQVAEPAEAEVRIEKKEQSEKLTEPLAFAIFEQLSGIKRQVEEMRCEVKELRFMLKKI